MDGAVLLGGWWLGKIQNSQIRCKECPKNKKNWWFVVDESQWLYASIWQSCCKQSLSLELGGLFNWRRMVRKNQWRPLPHQHQSIIGYKNFRNRKLEESFWTSTITHNPEQKFLSWNKTKINKGSRIYSILKWRQMVQQPTI